MPQYFTDLQVSQNKTEEKQLHDQGFHKIDVDLNKGVGGNHTYLWYMTGESGAITRIEFSFTDAMSQALNQAGYMKIDKNLYTGSGKKEIYLWFFKGTSEYHVPIVALDVSITDEAETFRSGWERTACDLSQEPGGHWVFLWVKREKPTYICDVTATVSGEGDKQKYDDGFIRLNVNTDRGAQGDSIFIWYRETTKSEGTIKGLQVNNGDPPGKGYKLVNVNLNDGTGGAPVLLWYKKDDISGNPIKAITLVVTYAAAKNFEEVHVEVIWKNLNEGVKDAPDLFLCYYC